jgi:zinc protease
MKAGFSFTVLTIVLFFQSLAQTPAENIPLDKAVKTGKLANGLTYYIRKNNKPENRAELRLVVNAGSVLERDDQQGIAHFLEHMAFNGTKNFPKNELLSYLQKAGVRFGADLNATTSFDFTLYMLPIPSNDETILKSGYQVLRDWAGGLLLEQEEIDKERGIIIEEKRMRQNAGQRTFAQYLPAMTNNSKYGQRVPIGKEEIIKTAPRRVFTDFYRDWYRPNNMAIIAVGDIDPVKTEALIKSLFSDLQNPLKAPLRPAITPITWHNANKASIVSDPENTNSILTMYIGLERTGNRATWTAYGNDFLIEIVGALFTARLQENFVNPKSPVSFGNISQKSDFLKGYQNAGIVALVKDNPATAINMMVGEALKAKQFGFTQEELDRVKKNFLKQYEDALLEKDKTESANYVTEYVEHFLNKTPAPGIEAEHAFVTKFVNSVSLETVNNKVKQFDLNKPSFILFNATEAMKNSITEADLLTAFEKAKMQKVEAYTERKVSAQLMETMPTPGKILNKDNNTALDSRILTLSNGIKVIYKKTNFKNDEIVFRGSQWGGTTNLTAAEIKTSKYFSLVNAMGLGNNKAVDMPKVMTGVEATVFINPGPYQLMLNGNASAKDFEKLLQIIYLKATKVNFDAAEFEGIKTNFASQIGGLLKNPNYKLIDTLNKVKFSNSNRLAGFPLEEEAKNLSMSDLESLYNKLTGNLNGAVLVFVGNIDEANFETLIEKYIASIPTQAQPVTLNKENILKPLTGKNGFVLKAGKENKSEINYTYYGKVTDLGDKELLSFILMTEILQMKATQKLREEMGNTYSPKVNGSIIRPPLADYSLSLNVSSLPENVDKITTAFDGLIAGLIKGELTDDDLQKAKAQRVKVLENQIKTNPYWSSALEQQFIYGFDPANIIDYAKKADEITKEDIIKIAGKYLSGSNILKGVLNPE